MDADTTFIWDPRKSDRCLRERGFDFHYAILVFASPYLSRDDPRDHGGEARIQVMGRIEGRLFNLVYTMRGPVCRIISARRAREKELRRWPR